MKNFLILLLIIAFYANNIFAQAGSVSPNPADVSDTVELRINLSDPACGCPGLQGAYAPTAEDPLYIWSWMPQDRPLGDDFENGDWDGSNPSLKMTQDTINDDIWYYRLVPTTFYNVSPSTVYNMGFAFLAKKKDGSLIVGETFEAKSADQIVPISSVGCVDKFCPYPTNYTDQDYLSITYNRKKELSIPFKNGDASGLYLFPKFSLVGAENTFLPLPDVTFATLTSFPDLKMNSIGDEKFESKIFLLRDLFQLQPGQEISEIQWRLANINVAVPNNFCPAQVDFPGCE